MGSDGLYPGKGVAMVMDGEGAAPGGPAGARRARGRALEAACLAAPPAVLVAAVLAGGAWAVPALAVAAASVGLVLAGWERSVPALRQLLPAGTLAAAATAGRILLAAVPDVKPVSAVVILCGACLGRRPGFLCGALAALASNLFFGQGMWTPWQMYAWGLMGYVAGALADRGLLARRGALCAYGFLSCMAYGAVLDAYTAVGFVRPLTAASLLGCWAASIPFDVVHGLSTVAFLLAVWVPWGRAIRRTVTRYGLR